MASPVPPRPDRESEPSGEAPPRPTWRPIEAIPVFIAAVVMAAVAGGVAAVLLHGCRVRFVAITLVGELASAVAVLGWVRLVNHGPLAALGAPRRPLVDLAAGLGTGLVLLLAGGAVLLVVRALASRILGHAPPEAQQVQACVTGSALFYLGPVVILVAPFGEELFFRGFLYQGLRRRLSVWPAALISAMAFGAAHYAGAAFLVLIPALVVVGIGLALVFEKRQSLLASMTAHAAFNLVGFLMLAYGRR